MKRLVYIIVAFCLGSYNIYSQVKSFKIKDQGFIEPTMDGINYLFTHVDSVDWNNVMYPLGFKSIPFSQRFTALEYKKEYQGISEYIGFDAKYGVLTFIWKDPSGKNIISKEMKKALKKKEYNSSGTYKIQHNGLDYVISLESNKEKAVYEMITVELERK